MTTLKNILGVSALSLAVVAAPLTSAFSDTANHWVAEYLPTAIEEGAIDSSKPEFRPNANINRAELVKIVVNYDNGGDNPTADDYEAAAGFSDVASSAWFYNHVNYAAEEGIVDGTKSTFRPAASMTRAEALKVITLALEVPSDSTNALPYGDVAADAWYHSYVSNAYNNCIIKGSNAFRPNDTITRAEAIKIFVASLNPGCVEPTTTVTPTETATPVETATPTGTTASSNTVEVVLSSATPGSASIPQAGSNIPFLALDITAGSAEDLKLTGLNVLHTGHGDDTKLKDVQAFDGFVSRGSGRSFASDTEVAELNLGSEAIIIPAGTTKTVFVKADTDGAAVSVTHGVQISSADDVRLYGVETGGAVAVSGSFPIVGNLMTTAGYSVGKINTVSYKSIDDETLEPGEVAANIAEINLDVDGTEDVYVRALTVNIDGNHDDGDLTDLFVEVDGVVVSDVVATAVSDKVTFDLTAVNPLGVLIEDTENEDFVVYATVSESLDTFGSSNTTKVIVEDDEDIVAIGAKHGLEVAITTINTSTVTFSYEGGDLEFEFTSETGDIPNDKDDVVFGLLTIKNMGPAVKIEDTADFPLNIIYANTLANAASDVQIEDIRLVNKATGQTVVGPNTPTIATTAATTTTVSVGFKDEIYINAGETLELILQGDVTDKADATDTVKFSLNLTTMATLAEGGEDLDDTTAVDVKPAGSIETNLKTIEAPTVTVAIQALNDDTYVKNSDDETVWAGTLDAGDVEDIKVTKLTFGTVTGQDADANDINSFTLQAKLNGDWETLESGVDFGSSFSFSSLDEEDGVSGLLIGKGEEVEIRVLADIASSVTAGHILKLELTAAEADDEDGDSVTVGGTLPASDAQFTLQNKGSIVITLDSQRTPDSAIALAGEEVSVAVYKFEAIDEDSKVEDLEFDVTGTSIESVALYYQDTGTAVLKVGGAPAQDTITGTIALIEGIDLTVEDGEEVYIEVRAIIEGIDKNDPSQTGTSGDIVTVTLDGAGDTDIKGNASGETLVSASPAGFNRFLVANNKLVATEVALGTTILTPGTKEAVKFTLDVQGDNEVSLEKVFVNISGADAAVASGNVNVTRLELFDGGTSMGFVADPALTGVQEITVTTDKIVSSGTTYVVKATVSGTTTDKAISFEVAVNQGSTSDADAVLASVTGTDGIVWRDYGENSDGTYVRWIDLGDSSVTTISGSLSN